MNREVGARYLYHPVLNNWDVVEEAPGVVIYQDDKIDFEAWQVTQNAGETWHTHWEHLYPGEITDWLCSPMESRGWIVPLDKVYNLSTWTHEELGSDRLVRLTPVLPEVTSTQVVVMKTFGDFGWGLAAFQDAAGKWYFMEYGFDGLGTHGDLWYVITDILRRDFTGKEEALPWDGVFPEK